MSKQNNLPIVPDGCIPLIGYSKKPSTLLRVQEAGRNFLDEREAAISVFKKNHGNVYQKIRTKAGKNLNKNKITNLSKKSRPLPSPLQVKEAETRALQTRLEKRPTENEEEGLVTATKRITAQVSSARSSKV